jgi:hypothetical protein
MAAISIAQKTANTMKINGNKTKNQEIPEYPLEHKKFKNHVHKRTNIVLTTTVIIDIRFMIAIRMAITDKTK